MAERLRDGRFPGRGSADEDDVPVFLDEPAGQQFLDDLRGELGPGRPVEAVERDGWAELAPPAAPLELAVPAGAVLGLEDLVEEGRVGRLRRLGLGQQFAEAPGSGGEG
jgi:hypothetical protein